MLSVLGITGGPAERGEGECAAPPLTAMRACFFVRTPAPQMLELVEFYRTDLSILRGLGFEVVVATRWSEIPWDADLYFVWWWTWAYLPVLKARLRRRPVIVTGTF